MSSERLNQLFPLPLKTVNQPVPTTAFPDDKVGSISITQMLMTNICEEMTQAFEFNQINEKI